MTKEALRTLHPGERTNPEGKPVSNKILLGIPDIEYGLLRPHLRYLDMPHHLSLHEPREKIEYAYFPNRGMVSLVIVTEAGKSVEVGVLGNEGFAGAPIAVGLRRSTVAEVVQIAGDGFRVGMAAMQRVLPSAPRLQAMLSRYAVLQGMQVAQTAACNRLHAVEQRLARWLLLAQDRVDSGQINLTHDFLAMMLGTDRPSVSLAANAMQKKKVIEYTRGAVKILNRKKLEGYACECYGVIQQFNGALYLK
ncbi:MAG TPA: Crp/Fnr family transcriptional regulator [Candidatus Acidoferrales bacterium]|nr:Crp/Fnr family transcriptional regulator [Candidatus Acidoferrales bacterium]